MGRPEEDHNHQPQATVSQQSIARVPVSVQRARADLRSTVDRQPSSVDRWPRMRINKTKKVDLEDQPTANPEDSAEPSSYTVG
jgi:hypothetical protein